MARVTDIFRHPLKSHGREALQRVTLSQGAAMPWYRHLAVAHDTSKADGSAWAACANFSRVSKAPLLMAITARLNEADQSLTLSHPNRKDFTFQPDDERQLSGFLAWVKPLMPADRQLWAQHLGQRLRAQQQLPEPPHWRPAVQRPAPHGGQQR